MKKIILLPLICTLSLVIGCDSNKSQAPSIQVENSTNTENESSNDIDNLDPKQIIEKKVREHIADSYRETEIERIEINENLGTDEGDDYIVLPHLVWNVKNETDMTQQMLELYSSDLAATLYNECPDVAEVCIFWTVPYDNNGSAKMWFTRENGGMAWGDKIYDGNLR